MHISKTFKEKLSAWQKKGMARQGIVGDAADQIVRAITSFALYGFPESHAASFALIAYASAYLKCHHPTAFLIGLLNAWPMGFYHPATLVKDAQRHGVTVLPVDVNHSFVECVWEEVPRDQRRRGGPVVTGGSIPSPWSTTRHRSARRSPRPKIPAVTVFHCGNLDRACSRPDSFSEGSCLSRVIPWTWALMMRSLLNSQRRPKTRDIPKHA